MIQIDTKTFYRVGIGCFSTVAVANILGYFLNIHNQNFLSSVISWAGIIFQITLVGFFKYLLKNIPQEQLNEGDTLSSEEIKEVMKI